MAAKRNNLLYGLVALILVMACAVLFLNSRASHEPPPLPGQTQSVGDGSSVPVPATPGVPDPSKDNVNETLRTVVAKLQSQENKLKEFGEQQPERAKERDQAVETIEGELEGVKNLIDELRRDFKQRVPDDNEPTFTTGGGRIEIPTAQSGDRSAELGFTPGTIIDGGTPQGYDTVNSAAGYVRAVPLYSEPLTLSTTAVEQPADTGSKLASAFGTQAERLSGVNNVPLATIPGNATLFDSTAMTALIGRTPSDNRVSDPLPVKIVIGKTNLAANGHRIAGIDGAIFAGRAIGDSLISCVRVEITSVLFVHDDGQTTYIDGQVNDRNQTASTGSQNNAFGVEGSTIGYISDRWGNPCVPGTKISDKAERTALITALGVAQGGANAYAEAEVTSISTGDGITSSLTGDDLSFVAGKALASGLSTNIDQLKVELARAYEVIYVPPGSAVAVHITQELAIDYAPDGRYLNYSEAQHVQDYLD